MRNPFKRQPTADPISAMREQRAALEAKASTLNAGKDRQPDATAVAPPASSAVSVAIHEHLHAYAGRLYAQVYKMEDADTRAEQERAAFRKVLHTPLASDADRLTYAKAVIERAAGVYGLECHGNTRAAWIPTAYRNLAFGEYAPEPDVASPEPDAQEAEREPKAAPIVPDARAFAVEQGALVDLSALSIVELRALFDRFDATESAWSAELHLPYANESRSMFRANTPAGNLIEREQERVAEIRDRIAAEISRRQPVNSRDADAQLATLIQHELMCNGDLRSPAIRARIGATWGDASTPAAVAESMARQPAPEAPASSTFVEAKLIALAAEYEGFVRAGDDALTLEDATGLPLPHALHNAIDRVSQFAGLGRESVVLHAMALPATTLLGFGVKAQILEHDAGAAWGENDDDTDIVRCHAFLHGLIAAAGLSPIPRLEVTSEEIRGWLADPEAAPGASRVKA